MEIGGQAAQQSAHSDGVRAWSGNRTNDDSMTEGQDQSALQVHRFDLSPNQNKHSIAEQYIVTRYSCQEPA
jgi:hypothetical protein